MSIGKNSIARAVNATAEVKTKNSSCAASGISSFSIDEIGILNCAKTPEEYGNMSDLKQSINKRGVLCPLLVCVTAKGDAWLLDGYRRLYAAKELGITQINAAVISAENKSEANRIYAELSRINKSKQNSNIHEEKFRVLETDKRELPVYLL